MALNAKANPDYAPKRINGKFAPGYSGNPGGSLEATRRSFNKDFLLALAADFKKHGAAAIEKVRKQQPAAYMKICALLVPRDMQIEHSGGVKAMTDEQLERTLEAIESLMGKAMFQMLGVFAEFEHSIIQERVRAGLQRAKRDGKRLGRPPLAEKLAERIRAAL